MCTHLAPRMVFALLFIRTKGVECREHPPGGKELMQLWFLYRTEYHVAIKNDIGNPDIDNPDNPDIKMLMLSCQNTKINYKTLLVFF